MSAGCNNNAGLATPAGVLQYAREIGVPLSVVQIFTGVLLASTTHVNEAGGAVTFRPTGLPLTLRDVRIRSKDVRLKSN